ncbi:MAG: hypothetical protein ABIJ14_00015 [Nanoarchaeota archaeon]
MEEKYKTRVVYEIYASDKMRIKSFFGSLNILSTLEILVNDLKNLNLVEGEVLFGKNKDIKNKFYLCYFPNQESWVEDMDKSENLIKESGFRIFHSWAYNQKV